MNFKIQSILVLIFAITVVVVGCVGLLDLFDYDKKIVGPYHVMYFGTNPGKGLYFKQNNGLCGERISPEIVSLGWNDRFLIAKQSPANSHNKINYFIIDMSKDSRLSQKEAVVIGPMTIEEFKDKRIKLDVPNDLDFSMDF